MSNFYLQAKNKKTGKMETFSAIDDYFGKHHYGYKNEERIYDEYDFDLMFEKIITNTPTGEEKI